ncbi:MAG: hypothetical protein Crog4KO_36460 [Crocinitomicaceae bacterium]
MSYATKYKAHYQATVKKLKAQQATGELEGHAVTADWFEGEVDFAQSKMGGQYDEIIDLEGATKYVDCDYYRDDASEEWLVIDDTIIVYGHHVFNEESREFVWNEDVFIILAD